MSLFETLRLSVSVSPRNPYSSLKSIREISLTISAAEKQMIKGLRALRPFFGPHLRSKYESGNERISLHNFMRPIFLVFHFGFSLDLAVH